MAKSSIIERFKYMAFMYTCLFKASYEGKTCFDPLFFHYPTIDNSFYDIQSTFIVGDALKVIEFRMSSIKREKGLEKDQKGWNFTPKKMLRILKSIIQET